MKVNDKDFYLIFLQLALNLVHPYQRSSWVHVGEIIVCNGPKAPGALVHKFLQLLRANELHLLLKHLQGMHSKCGVVHDIASVGKGADPFG